MNLAGDDWCTDLQIAAEVSWQETEAEMVAQDMAPGPESGMALCKRQHGNHCASCVASMCIAMLKMVLLRVLVYSLNRRKFVRCLLGFPQGLFAMRL